MADDKVYGGALDINGKTEKTSPAANDLFLIEDSDASNVKKKVKYSNIGTGDVSGPSSSVDNEIVLFSGTGGKTLKRAATTGILKGTSGVISAATWTQYLLPYADTTTSLSQIAIGTSGQVLTSNGAGSAPSFQAASGGTSKWTTLVSTTDFSTTAASTSTITMNTDQTANILVGYAIKFTLSSVVYYAQVTALTSNLMTIRGAPLTTGAGDLTALSYSVLPSQVDVLDLSVDGYYEDATDSTLILNDMRRRFVWEESKAYIVGWDMSQIVVDTGTEANVTVMVNAAAVGTANTNQGPTMSSTANTVVSTVVDINSANYDINRGELLDVQVTKAGTGDARDMTLFATVVYP